MKTCIFGGTFDPPHIGHLLIAQTVFESEHFERLIFVPANISPTKKNETNSSPKTRLKMLEISLINNTNFEISDIEIKREGISYTVDTLEEFVSSSNLDKKDLFFLMGSDTLRSFHTWKDPERIME
jgi:nicotinate-nucleotide adenylyltransferase